LLDEARPFRLHESVHPHGLSQHGAHDGETRRLLVVAAVLAMGKGDSQSSHRAAADRHRYAHVGQLALAVSAEDAGAVQEERLAAHLRHHDGPAALHHPARDALAGLVVGAARLLPSRAHRRLDRELVAVTIAQGHGGADRSQALLDVLEHAAEGGPDVEGGGKGLADFEEVGQYLGLGGGHGKRESYRIVARISKTDNRSGRAKGTGTETETGKGSETGTPSTPPRSAGSCRRSGGNASGTS